MAEELGNVSQACKIFGFSRDRFYRYRELFDKGGEIALQEISRKKPILKNLIEPEVETAVVEMATMNPAFGRLGASNELRKQGVAHLERA
ncbi:helix-turn-helix domain-containing protein [Chitinophaga sp. 2R12]|uniref:Helix-turn-helix domain-containing protein n=1 Tax=Chitinophaga hostae TaxID=2831022 RepID=A0ABS5IW83_9BACT|nr:helix-turn-helix domain-containing protein [Chitinophaga hostae]